MSLRIAENLELPAEAITQTFAILAKRGVGKTYTASVFVEEIIKAGLPVVVVDPIGVWWGLRASADGKGPGLPIVIAGGDHADVPITPGSGEAVALLVVEEKVSLVVDLSLFRKAEQRRFMADFAETLYRRNREALHLVLDEADAFAPQRVTGEEARMLGAMEDIVRRGRARGLGVTMITQRPAALNKNVLTQIEVLVALRLTAPNDQKALDEWIRTHADEGQRDKFMKSLPSLPVGTAWFWSPGWLDIFKRVKVRQRETFDSSSTPKVGQVVKMPDQLARVDLEAIRKRLAATLQEAETDDPKELRRQVRELRAQLSRQQPREVVKTKEVVKTVEVPVLRGDELARLEAIADSLTAVAGDIKAALERAATPAAVETAAPPPTAKQQSRPAVVDDQVGEGPTRILNVLAAHKHLSRTQLATLARYSPRSGTYSSYLSRLRQLGLIETDLTGITITSAGRKRAGSQDVALIESSRDLMDAWRERLQGGERRVFDVLTQAYPRVLSRQEVAERAGLSSRSGTYSSYVGKLRRNGLIESAGTGIRASDSLFSSKTAA